MTRTVGIIGLGHVGATTAYTLVSQGLVDTLVLIDNKPDWATAEALDLKDALGGLPHHVNLIVNDYQALHDADVVVFAAGDISVIFATGDRTAETTTTKVAIDEAAPQLAASGFHGVLLNISNPCDVAVNYWQTKLPIPKAQIIGTGTALDTYRMRRAVAEALSVNVADVTGYTLGEHGDAQFNAWSTVGVNQTPIASFALDLAALDDAVKAGGYAIFTTRHYTNYAIATVACDMVIAIISDAHRVFACACFDVDKGLAIGHLATLGRIGVVANPPLVLPPVEQAAYDHAATTIQTNFDHMLS